MPLEGIYGDVFRGICTQSFVLNEQQEEIVLQLFTWGKKTNVSYLTKSCIIILGRYLSSGGTNTHFITQTASYRWGGFNPPPEIPKVLQIRAKLSPIVKIVKNC